MEQIALEAQVRKERGKEVCKKLRKGGLVPAVVYGEGKESVSLVVSAREMQHILHGGSSSNVIINLKLKDDKKTEDKTVMIKGMQFDPVKDSMVHIDFHEISLTETIAVKVSVESKGEAIGVKQDGGILEHAVWEIEIECLPTQIPKFIEVDVTNLAMNKTIHLGDIVLPEGVVPLDPPETVLFAVVPPKMEEEVTAEEEAAEGAPEEPEVIKQKTEEEIQAEQEKKEKKDKKEKKE